VFSKGNAMAATGDSGLEDTSSIPSTAYATVALAGLTSPAGLIGSYVDCHTTTASSYRAAPDGSGNYTHTRSTTPSLGARFDAVMTYYYVDFAQRYLRNTLGFTDINNRPVKFNINGTTQDSSWYSPNSSGTGELTLGSGGVDDGEDAEVTLHEYGHAIQDNSRPNIWGTAGTRATVARTGAMGEGFGDYFACSITAQHFEQAGAPYETTCMEWDAASYSSAVPPTIRSITSGKHYPEDVDGEVHADGEIWSSTLWQIRADIGAVAADRVVLQSHFLLPTANATFTDGAQAILAAADGLGYTEAQKDAIRNRFTQRGILSGGGGGCSSSTTAIAPGSTQSASLAATDCFSSVRTSSHHDKFTFTASPGVQYTITMSSTAFDTWLVLKDPSGATSAQDDDGNGGTNSRIVYTPTVGGTFTVEATSFNAGATGAYTVSLAGSGGGGAELIANGGFESGDVGWSRSTASIITNSASAPAFAGAWKATLLGRGTTASASLHQAPSFPATGSTRTLRFYLRMTTQEDTSAVYDKLYVRITNSSNATLTTLARITNVDQATYATYALVTLTIPAGYAVAGNRLRFYAVEDSMLATAFYIDNVSIL
jgi:hypothetical protein